jgi:ABC-type transport system substrate-binding protein
MGVGTERPREGWAAVRQGITFSSDCDRRGLALYSDPSDFYGPILGCGGAVPGGWNWAKYRNKEIDALAAKADGMASSDQAEARIDMRCRIYSKIMDEAPWGPAMNETRFALHSARIGGKDIFFTDPNHIPVHYDYVSSKDVQ